MLRVVLDTNVLVSAVISNGKPRELFKIGIAKKRFYIVTSDMILKELEVVLSRSKFKTSQEEIHRIILLLKQTAEVVNVKSKFKAVKEDPKDDMVISTAYDGRADMIVSGDSHLLGLGNFKGISIVSVEQMLACLREKTA
jgi:uncharacterized protein